MKNGANPVFEPDVASLLAQVEEVLFELKLLRNEPGFLQSVGPDTAERLQKGVNAARARISAPFSLVIVGDFKRGKSTLINALLGKPLVPTAVTPETVTINQLSYAETPSVTAYLANGRKTALTPDSLTREELRKLAEILPAPIRHIEIKDDAPLLRELSIVDTPGIGDLLQAHDQQVAEYLAQADALVYVVSARAPLSLSEQAFLHSAVLPQQFARLMVVVNMADTLETEENIEKIKALTETRLAEIGPELSCHVVSALDAFAEKTGKRRPELELADTLSRAFDVFESALGTEVLSQRELIKATRAAALTKSVLGDLQVRIGLLESSLRAGLDDLRTAESAFAEQSGALSEQVRRQKEALCADIDDMRREAERWITAFLTRMRGEVAGIDQSVSVGQIERNFQFYAIDLVKQAVSACVSRHQKDISDRLDAALAQLGQELCKDVFGRTDSPFFVPSVDASWTHADSANFFMGMIGMNAGLTLLGNAVTGFLRQNTVNKEHARYGDAILREWDTLVSQVLDKVRGIYEQLKQSAAEALEENEKTRVEASREALRQAKSLSEGSAARVGDTLETLQTLRARIAAWQNSLLDL